VGTKDNKFMIINIEDLTAPAAYGNAYDFAAKGSAVTDFVVSKKTANRIFVAHGYFSILDISDHNAITVTGEQQNTPCEYLAVNSAETRAYCSSSNKLYTIDISSPATPNEIGTA